MVTLKEEDLNNEETDNAVELLKAIIKLKPGGETRQQQMTAVDEISKSITQETNLLLEATTGTGKTLSYLIPIIYHNTKAVISTANKQLSEQIVDIDIPFLRQSLKKVAPTKQFNSALLKGRDNYFCLAKDAEQSKLSGQAEALFSMEETSGPTPTSAQAKQMGKEIQQLEQWSKTTKTGDRSEAPPVSDQVWRQFSSTTTECPGKKVCPFGESCFAEYARDKARTADIVVTNHAVVANDLQAEESPMLGERELFVFDELHELDNYLSSAWGTRLTAKMLKDAHKVFKTLPDLKEEYLEELEVLGKKFNGVCNEIPEGVIEGKHQLLDTLMSRLYAVTSKCVMQASKIMKDDSEREGVRKVASIVVRKSTEMMDATVLIMDDTPNTVRWITVVDKENPKDKAINAAPLRVGPQLQQALADRGATMVGTSATIRVNGGFDIPVHNLDLKSPVKEYNTVALDSPFDYEKQAIMYIPSPTSFPAPIGANREEHASAAKTEAAELIEATGGRALSLHTTSYAARETAKFLRKQFPKMNILLQGDAPAPQIIDEFKRDEKSVLVATMGMWHGLDAQGPTCSLVVIDKIPFKPMNDPLSTARQKWANDNGRNGFMDVYVADANVMLAQGAGRLVRSLSDKGVVAILDTRLISKPYGRSMLKSLPGMKIFQDKTKIVAALKRLATSLDNK